MHLAKTYITGCRLHSLAFSSSFWVLPSIPFMQDVRGINMYRKEITFLVFMNKRHSNLGNTVDNMFLVSNK